MRVFVLLFSLVHAFASQAETQVWIPGWQNTASLHTPRAGAATVSHGGVIYILGGIDGRDFLASTEFARQNTDGTLAPWQTGPALTEPRGFFAASVVGNAIYAIGGGNGPAGHNLLNTIERAEINRDGTLGPWRKETQTLNLPRRCAKTAVLGNRLYAFGGFGGALLDTVESAPILPDGTLGPWRVETNKMSLPRYVHATKAIDNNTVVAIGGHQENQGAGLVEVEMAKLNDKGELGPWRVVGSLSTGRFALEMLYYNGFVYAFGGLEAVNYLRDVEKAVFDTSKPLQFETTNPLSTRRANFSIVNIGKWVYVIGGTNQDGYFDMVEYAMFNDYGNLGFWGNKEQAHAYERDELQFKGGARLAVSLPRQGVVVEHIPAGQYSYLKLDTAEGEEWIAVGAAEFSPGQHLSYSEGIVMQNFESKALAKTFATIRFVSRVEFADAPARSGFPH